jgi:predicted dehydrogenase
MGELKRIKAALIGSGAISGAYLSNITKKFHIVELVGCSDIIPERSEKRAQEFNIKQMTNEEILADKDIQIVINTTYPLAHHDVSKAALLAGKHVYAEKMMAVGLDEGRELIELAKSKNLNFTMAPDTFLGAGWQSARHAIDSGLIGEPITAMCLCIRSYRINAGEHLAPRLGMVFAPGGGIPFDMGGYYLHNLINLFGSIKRVSGFIKARNPVKKYLNPKHPKYGEDIAAESPNTMVSSLEFENGLYANFTVTSECAMFHQPVFEIHGTEGILTCFDPNDFNGSLTLRRPNAEPVALTVLHGYSDENRGIGVADMAYAIKNNRRPRAHFDMGYHAFEVIHGMIDCCNTGSVYTMKSKCPRPTPVRPGFLPGGAQESFLDD